MSKTKSGKRFTARQKVAVATAPLCATLGVVGYNVINSGSAGAAGVNASQTSFFNYTDDSNHAVSCKIVQHIEHPRNNDNQLALGSTTISLQSGPAGDCTTFTNAFCQGASWTDPFGVPWVNNEFEGNDCRPGGNTSPISLEYAPFSGSQGDGKLTVNSSVHFTHCIESTNNHCDASFTFVK
jgi:hypothetical protein